MTVPQAKAAATTNMAAIHRAMKTAANRPLVRSIRIEIKVPVAIKTPIVINRIEIRIRNGANIPTAVTRETAAVHSPAVTHSGVRPGAGRLAGPQTWASGSIATPIKAS